MSLHDLIAEFEAEVASLFARFRSHPVVQEVTAAAPPAAAPAAPAPEPVKVEAAPENTTDATAPGFHAPPQVPAPEPGPVSGDGAFDPYAHMMDWNRGGMGSALVYRVHAGGGEKVFYVPEGYVGYFTVAVGDNTESRGSGGYDCRLSGPGLPGSSYHAANGNNEVTDTVYVGMAPTNPADPRVSTGEAGPYTLTVQCEGEASIVLRHWP